MPDKTATEMDNDWLDAGWADMERRLDVAMPVNESRRRPVGWWWAGAGLIVLLVLAWAWWTVPAVERLDFFPLPGGRGAQVALPPPAVEEGSLLTDGELAAELATAKRLPSQTTTSTATPDRTTTALAASRTLPTEPISPIRQADQALSLPVPPGPVSTNPMTDRQSSAVIPTTERISEPDSPVAARQPWSTDVRLPLRPIGPLAYDPTGIDHAVNSVVGRPGLLRFGTELTGNIGLGPANGIGLGALAHWETRRRFSLDAGLRYHRWEQTWGLAGTIGGGLASEDAAVTPDTSGMFFDRSVASYVLPRQGGGSYRIVVAANPAENARVETHWLELPLHLRYRFAGRWELSGGVRPALLLNSAVRLPAIAATTNTTGGASAERISLSSQEVEALQANSSSQRIVGPSGELLRHWHVGWEAGIDFRVNAQWTVGGYYRSGQNIWRTDSDLRSRTGLAGVRLVRWW